MLHLHAVEKSFGAATVLKDVHLHIAPREKTGLIGVNGSGKTTLLRIITGETPPDKGSVIFSAPCQTALLSQEVTVKPYHTLHDEMRRALPHLVHLERKLRALEEEMIAEADNVERMEELLGCYAGLQEEYERGSGHDLEWKIDCIIQGLGFSLRDKGRYVSEFSGGWQMRMELAKLLLREVDLLLLDEPTNHLDLAATRWLEDYLREYPGAVVIVSHDRYFLNRVTTATLHIERGSLTTYRGNYDLFVRERNKTRELQEKAYHLQQKKLERDMRFIERFRYKARLASRVKSREKMVEKMEKVEAPSRDLPSINLAFEYEDTQMTTVFRLKDLEKHYGSLSVPLRGEIEIRSGERLAIVGENGAGKTTLLSLLSGDDLHFSGKLRVHQSSTVRYYRQNHQLSLRSEHTVLEELQDSAPPGMSLQALRTLLGNFLFRGDDVFKRVEVLSGGEKARLALAQIVASSSNVLLLDEPTNHLDIDSREALAEALEAYEGTIIVVSHDRYFIDQVCARVIEIEKGVMADYPGNYSYYFMKKSEGSAGREPLPEKAKLVRPKKARHGPAEKSTGKKLQELEETICGIEKSLKRIEEALADPHNISDPQKVKKLSEDYALQKKLVDDHFAAYEELYQTLEH
ncbi:MAG: ABC-F family ATP-binding cassette domain-containing protein [Candidatus Eremiobacteraeota bacterium]|nr:ABC-F family ATP-binding cassette domain-containing protein [Candidatus Eremiobacteraeota bacterium]